MFSSCRWLSLVLSRVCVASVYLLAVVVMTDIRVVSSD